MSSRRVLSSSSAASSFSQSSASSLSSSSGPTWLHRGPRSSSSPSDAPSCTSPTGCPAAPPATLYLYTFLSTLIILVIVSAGIILRSIVLRRRQQINGTWMVGLPPGAPVRRRDNPYANRPPPKIFDVYIVAEEGKRSEGRWGAIMPLSAMTITPILVKSSGKSETEINPAVRPTPLHRVTLQRIRNIWPNRRHPPMANTTPSAASPSQAAPTVDPSSHGGTSGSDQTRVAVFIAMPSPQAAFEDNDNNDEENELPHLQFGVLDVEVVDTHPVSDSGGVVGEGTNEKEAITRTGGVSLTSAMEQP